MTQRQQSRLLPGWAASMAGPTADLHAVVLAHLDAPLQVLFRQHPQRKLVGRTLHGALTPAHNGHLNWAKHTLMGARFAPEDA